MNRISIFAITVLLAAWAVACGAEIPTKAPRMSQNVVTGLVVEFASGSLTQIKEFSVQDYSGSRWHFRAEGYQGWVPSHLRDHMVQGSPITVTYHQEAGVLIVDKIEDARDGA